MNNEIIENEIIEQVNNEEEVNNDELLKSIKERVEPLTKLQHIEIFKIFKEYDIPFSENSNGTFINISEVSIEVLNKVSEYLDYLNSQEKELNILEKEKQLYKENFFD